MIEGLGTIAKLKYSDFNFVTLSRYMGVGLAGFLIIQAKCNMQHNSVALLKWCFFKGRFNFESLFKYFIVEIESNIFAVSV